MLVFPSFHADPRETILMQMQHRNLPTCSCTSCEKSSSLTSNGF